jgi:hypothetical protein
VRAVVCFVLVALAAAGCQCGSQPSDQVKVAENEDEERCDPKEPKVCVGNSLVACEENGHLGRRLRTCKDGCRNNRCVATCDDDANKLIYLVDDANNFLSYDPRKNGDPFRLIGKLDCGDYTSPFSMSVDRQGTAWVGYQSGEVYKVDIHTAKCEPSGFAAGSANSRTFGMGFATDDAGGKTEKLYISAERFDNNLSVIDTDKTPPTVRSIGRLEASIDRNPELTGTSEGKLFGFFPVGYGNSFIQEIDKKSGKAVGQKWDVGNIGSVSAWAFAQWGGMFFVFVTVDTGPRVLSVNRTTNESKVVMSTIPYRVTGAGVSTCAPERDGGQNGP